MKTAIYLFFIFFALICQAQTYPNGAISQGVMSYPALYPLKPDKPVKIDTVKCLMVYVDMAIFTNRPDQNIQTNSIVTVGYSIKKSNSIYVEYLDFYKRPLSKSVFVFFSKDLPK